MFKVVGPLWAQATAAGGNNVFARLVKTGKKVLRRFLQQREIEQTRGGEIPKPTWTLRSQTVKVEDSARGRLIGGLFPKQVLKSQAAELRKQAALRLIRDARKVPVFAFVGLSLGLGPGASLDHQRGKGEAEDDLCSGIRGLFQQYGGKECDVETEGQHFSLQSLQLGRLIGQGCNAAVFEARPADNHHAAEVSESDDRVEDGEKKEEVEEEEEEEAEEQGAHFRIDASPEKSSLTEDSLPSLNDDEDDDDFSIISEEDDDGFNTISDNDDGNEDDDDFSIISEDGEESGAEEERLKGWVLYRVSSASAPGGEESCDGADDDNIIILAGDEDGLESLPEPEDLAREFSGSVCRECPPLNGAAVEVKTGIAHRQSDPSEPSVQSSFPPDTGQENSMNVSNGDPPEPAPNIAGEGGGGGREGGQKETEGGDAEGEFSLAVKMMYNYSVESRADHIMSAMVKETLPSLSLLSTPPDSPEWEHSRLSMTKQLPPHPNMVSMYDVFVDQTPDLPEGAQRYPSALPPRLNREGGFGRNATMFLVMKKYSMTLSEYLSAHTVDMHTRCLLFAQLLEGVAHLAEHQIAHRDLKGNNILLDLSAGTDSPRLAISDFGSCLADRHYGLTLPYPTQDTDRGGNSALMAPEIKCAVPGPRGVLDYSKADLWAAGTLAYEIFGDGNPFYHGWDSRSYCEEDLPQLAGDTPEVVVKLVDSLMRRDPAQRPSPGVAATCMALFLWSPAQLHPFSNQDLSRGQSLWRYKDISYWLQRLTVETVCQRAFGGEASSLSRLDLQMKSTFLSRISLRDVWGMLSFQG